MNILTVFKERFSKLNNEQKLAVRTTEGPVMVIAGPGTGKTEVLSARIAYILQNPDSGSHAHNILGLTYTEAGVTAMRKRLLEFIGPDAYKINIHTFHSFCNQVIQDNLEYFGNRELALISELEVVQFLENLVNSFTSNHPLFRPGEFFEVNRLKSLFTIMKQENYSVEMIQKAINDYLSDLPNRPEFVYQRKYRDFQKGDLKKHKIAAMQKKMEILLAAAQEFPQYQKMLKKTGKYDYQDMIAWVTIAFSQKEEILAKYQEQFLYILVDEYQDTNGLQNQLIDLLTNYWQDPNIFIVGDDDQSIFRFQGANLRNIMYFYKKYENTVKTIVLSKNYRSSSSILKTAESCIENNKERLCHEISLLDKKLIAESSLKNSKICPQIREYWNTAHEEMGIVEEILNLQKKGVNLEEVAIIYKEHRQAENIIKILEQKKIPVNVKQSVDILAEPLIKNILLILNYLNQEFSSPRTGDDLVFKILHNMFFEITASDIAVLFYHMRVLNQDFKKRKISVIEIISNKTEIAKLKNLQAKSEIEIIGQNLQKWIKNINNYTVPEQIEIILTEGKILPYVLKSKNSVYLLRVLNTFFNFIKEECKKDHNFSLDKLLTTFEQMEKHAISLPINKMILQSGAVNFVTAHSAKGLEFQYVFLIGCETKVWDKKRTSSQEYFFPDTLTLSSFQADLEETRRLFFVALTRAKEYLFISYAASQIDGRELLPSTFIAELLDKNDLKVIPTKVTDENIITYNTLLMTSPLPQNNYLVDKENIDFLLTNYVLTPTDLNKYLQCPVSFYFENILKIPQATNEYMGFGNVIHYALEHFFRFIKNQPNQKITTEIILNFLEKGFSIYRHSFTAVQYKKRLEYGKKILKGYFEKYHPNWITNTYLEYKIHNTSTLEIPISGKIDKIEILEKGVVNVIDYKTGSHYKALSKIKPPKNKEDLGGDYWRQMVFYKILLDNDKKQNWILNNGIIDFIEPDKNEQYQQITMKISKEDERIVQEQIHLVYQKIMNHEFFHGCNEEKCFWCGLLKENIFNQGN